MYSGVNTVLKFMLRQSFLWGTKSNPSLCVGLRIGILPKENKLIIACALDNSKIQIILQNEENNWIKYTTLSGHEDWVRGLDFTVNESGDLLLASCSQDGSLRLWCILSTKDNENKDFPYKILLESVLNGHEGWVYSVNWSPTNMQLLSASIDKTMIIWEFDKESGLWLESMRVGEVGGNTLGFYGGCFNSTADRIIAYSYHGAFHIWTKGENGRWLPDVTVGGHFGAVVDLAWEPQGDFLYSVSVDQTARIHGPWQKENKEITWHEIARPQVHGYDLSSMAVISRYKYASSAEEKIVRTFEAPTIFIDNMKRLCRISEGGDTTSDMPKGASVPSLGLSNKAVFIDDNLEDTVGMDKNNHFPEESHFVAQILTEPPTEETLLQNTLWPEIQKLNTSTWQEIQRLISHTLTVVQMQFSPDSQNLLSVSRDRRWSMFSKNSQNKFELVATTDKHTSVHTRIIWTCAWTHDSKYFATGSRDGKLVMWTKNADKEFVKPLGQYEKTNAVQYPGQSVTAVAFGPDFVNGGYLCAAGFEDGKIEVLIIKHHSECNVMLNLDTSAAHHLTVRKLAFRPKFGRAGEKEENKQVLQLSSCSSDMSVRIYDLIL
ncbi:unnamed protein product [Ceutorhynchus assimilis]|uniref:Elongator complex protein 2 n=1 Tax=Ceutorhynchus assimilis TaxID=467358 RepID=A0A9N9MJB5_9CUCU|nr:unnamed protein product [Ceutorhynchus assimilis]